MTMNVNISQICFHTQNDSKLWKSKLYRKMFITKVVLCYLFLIEIDQFRDSHIRRSPIVFLSQ